MQDPNKLLAKIVRRLRTIGTDTQLVEVTARRREHR